MLLKTNRETGLATQEAKERLYRYGPNVLEKGKGPSALRILVSQFSNLLIVILLAATVISGFLGELVDAVVILIIVALVVALGFAQEYRTERVLAALKKMQSRTASVVRNGETIEIGVEELVPGDIVLVTAGDKVSTDMRLVESFNLLVDEAPLTGESVPVSKTSSQLPSDTPLADRTNMLFSGTAVTDGKGIAVTVLTGMRTELGKIAKQVTEKTPKTSTSFERRMSEIGKNLGIIVVIIICAIVAVSLFEEYFLTGGLRLETILAIMLFGVALAVAAIPEALPAIIVGSLAIGAHRMAKENALTRNLSAVETLGSAQIVCSDKTGTLTKGEMTVTEFYTDGRTYAVSGVGYEPLGQITSLDGEGRAVQTLEDLAIAVMLCNDAVLVKEEESERWSVKGDPTEGALVVLAEKMGVSQQKVITTFPRVWEIPFSSESKRMTTIHRTPSGEEIAYMKGAPESVLEKCAYRVLEGEVTTLGPAETRIINGVAESMAARALRVLAIGKRQLPSGTREKDSVEKEFVFLGVVGMIDPPRLEATEAIRTAKRVGIKPIMITGDHKTTALAIASQMDIYEKGDLVLTGDELQHTTDDRYDEIVEKVTVYARVTPSDKLRIVNAWQKKGSIVAMTGDGVNDAPALKRADIGIAMGITGTEVAKDAADLILLDDNFATIMKAVKLGRWIQDNVKKYLAYLLSANLVEIAVLSIGALVVSLFIPKPIIEPLVPLLAVQVLYINLATDGLPALAVGIGPPDPDVMERPVQKKGQPTVFSREVRKFIAWILAAETPLFVLVYFTALPEGIDAARTRLFLAFVFVELVMALSCSSLRFTISKVKPHKWLVLSVAWEAIAISILAWVPQTRDALHITNTTLGDIEWIAIAMIFTFVYIECLKRFPHA